MKLNFACSKQIYKPRTGRRSNTNNINYKLWLPTNNKCHLQISKTRTIKTTYICGSGTTEWPSSVQIINIQGKTRERKLYTWTTSSGNIICNLHIFLRRCHDPLTCCLMVHIFMTTYIHDYIFYFTHTILLIFLFCLVYKTPSFTLYTLIFSLFTVQVFCEIVVTCFSDTFIILSLDCKGLRSHICLQF